MGKSLKDALLKVGLQPSQPQVIKKPQQRHVRQETKKVHDHQKHQTTCELCQKFAPDVEYYEHRTPRIKAKWLCLVCADENSISDEYRTSQQSDESRRKTFRRQFGRTKRFFKK